MYPQNIAKKTFLNWEILNLIVLIIWHAVVPTILGKRMAVSQHAIFFLKKK